MILIVVLAKVVGNYNIGSEEIGESEKSACIRKSEKSDKPDDVMLSPEYSGRSI